MSAHEIAGLAIYAATVAMIILSCAYAASFISKRRYGYAGAWIGIALVNFTWLFARVLNHVWDHAAVVEIVVHQ